ncbi:MAG TPA: tyrosine--tRNA ligase [Thermoplasmata archaeon]|nr:tyrosine--tRNA ligase [Thermoplasmata archaeon]
MDLEHRVDLIARGTEEVLTRDELHALLERESHPRAYIGFEPSGLLTVGHMVCARKMRDLIEAGCELTVFLADWHAWINDKLGGSLERIGAAGEYMREAFTALGVDADRAKYRWAHELTGSSGYWSRVVRIGQSTSLARTKRAMTILGRSEEEAQLDTAKLFYPSMQAADIFELPVEIAYAGLDQRRAHVLAREVAHQHHWPVPVAVHTPLISSLKGGGRMDPAGDGVERKMSKSDPTSSIVLPSPPQLVRERIAAAFCPAKVEEANPIVEIARHIIFPQLGELEIARPAKFGGPLHFSDVEAFRTAWAEGGVHPQDLKSGVAEALVRLVQPVADHFAHHPERLEALRRGAPHPAVGGAA